MELRFSPLRIAIFVILTGVFAALGGFSFPEIMTESGLSTGKGSRAWVYCILMFFMGAACVSLIDHHVGYFPPISIRPLYVIVGIIMMSASYIWIDSLRTSREVQLG